MTTASPFHRVESVLSIGFSDRVAGFQCVSNLVLGVVCFLLSWAIFDRFCGEQKETAPSRVGVARSRGVRRKVFSPGRPWKLALAWKDFYFVTGGKLWIFVKLLIYGIPLVTTRCWPQKLGGPPPWEDFGLGTFWFMVVLICVELAFAASAIFRTEHQGQTLSSLAMLPQGLRRVAYEKLLGVLPSLLAAGAYLALSVPLIIPPFLRTLKNMDWNSRWAPEQMIIPFFLGAQGFFFLHLVALLSLYVKRGALPLGIAIHFLLSMFAGVMASFMFRDEAGFYFLFMLTCGAVLLMHVLIGRRLEALAAEG